jgi:hypothetical protein
MTEAAQRFVRSFRALPTADQRDALVSPLRKRCRPPFTGAESTRRLLSSTFRTFHMFQEREAVRHRLIFAGILAMAALWLSACGNKEDAEIAKLKDLAKNILIIHLKSNLKDPDSAQLKDVVFYYHGVRLKSGVLYPSVVRMCGLINAKNSYGGYTGYRSFASSVHLVSAAETVISEIDDPDTQYRHESFKRLEADTCRNTERDSRTG